MAPNDGSKPQFHPAIWLFLEVLLIIAYAAKPSRHRRLFFLPIAGIILYSLIFTRMDQLHHVGMTEVSMGCRLLMILLWASTNILLCDIQHELRLVKVTVSQNQKPSQSQNRNQRENGSEEEKISEQSFLKRLWWAIIVWGNPRGINFAHEPIASIPPRPKPQTRLTFLVSQTLSALRLVFYLDLTGMVNRANPYYAQEAPVIDAYSYQRLWRLAGVFYGVLIYLILEIEYKVASILSVSVGISRPEDWPDFFGSFKEGYTLRRFWGRTWHQMFRVMALTHARYFSQILRIPPKSALASSFTIYCAFFLSGLLHYAGDAVAMQSLTRPGVLQFFILQAVGITLEDAFFRAMRSGRKQQPKKDEQQEGENAPECDAVKLTKTKAMNGVNTSSRCVSSSSSRGTTTPNGFNKALGYLWVILWLNLTLPLWTDPQYRNGYTRELPNFSVILGVWKGDWVPLGR